MCFLLCFCQILFINILGISTFQYFSVMLLEIQSRLQNSTLNSNISMYFGICDDTMLGILFWTVFSGIFSLFGVPACVAVLWELFQRHRKGTFTTPNDIFMLNLTVMDFLFLGSLPFAISNFLSWHIWPLEHCGNFLYTLTLSGRPLFMTCICLDCYLAVVHPITYRARKGLTPRVLMSIAVWVVTVAYGSRFIILKAFDIGLWTIVPNIIALPIIMVCDLFLFRALNKPDPTGRDIHPQKKKALQIIFNSLVMAVLCYLPPVFVYIYGTSAPITEKVFVCTTMIPSYITPTMGSAVMPILYLGNLGKLDWSRLSFCKSA